MNDEQILQRGGDEEEIEQYAKEHGADLTEEDVIKQEIADILGLELEENEWRLIVVDDNGNALEYSDWTEEVNQIYEYIIKIKKGSNQNA